MYFCRFPPAMSAVLSSDLVANSLPQLVMNKNLSRVWWHNLNTLAQFNLRNGTWWLPCPRTSGRAGNNFDRSPVSLPVWIHAWFACGNVPHKHASCTADCSDIGGFARIGGTSHHGSNNCRSGRASPLIWLDHKLHIVVHALTTSIFSPMVLEI